MATRQGQALGRLAVAPAVAALAAWSIVPLALAIYYAFLHYQLDNPDNTFFAGWSNFYYFVTDPFFAKDLFNTVALVLLVLAITIAGGVLLAILLDRPMWGQGIVRVMVISPFFIMPTVSALVWKNLMMHPVYGFFAHVWRAFGLTPVDWFASIPLLSVGIIVGWQWLPFATLILLTALQSLDLEQKDAAQMDGAGTVDFFRHITLPHLMRPITVVILIETIFLLNVFAEIKVTSVGGLAGNLTYLVFSQLNDANDVGEAAAGGLIAVVLANLVSAFLVRIVGRNLEA
ncbi:MAG: sugar ABC transporter permease [Hyphomicrobiales bacterium]|nr:sugar ABC transporter permease [Hyphomicrobiales bacterium]MDE2017222.1 sugar ABC transporter permease [Hyphomicrobiales bacterium]